jgi:N-acetyl sugar amidotransferase
LKKAIQVCSKTVLDTTIPGIRFDEEGVCQFCSVFEELDKLYPLNNEGQQALGQLVEKIKAAGKGKRYDCIVGVSGGTDSTYTLYLAKKLGLRPLAVHFDNGWNSKLAVRNIKNVCEFLDVDLYTYVVDWDEFRNIQISFLKASTPDAEIPTDVGIHATLIKTAAKENVHYVLNGHSFRTEFMMPIGWTYMDGRYIKDVNRTFNKTSLKSFPNFTLLDLVYYSFIKKIKVVPFLNYVDYSKETAKQLLKEKVNWEYSGGHHHESIYTRFFQSYYLPHKFGIDKRKTALSAEILSGQRDRNDALEILKKEYSYDPEVVEYVIGKLGLSKQEFENIKALPIKSFKDYNTYYPLIQRMKFPIRLATRLKLLPSVLYYKYFEI